MSRRIPPDVVRKIKKLRSEGWTIPELSKKFAVGRASVSRYTKNTKILPEFEDLWLSKRRGSVKRKEKAEKDAAKKAEMIFGDLSDKERLLILSSLYWAEGAKVDSNLTNTDPDLIKIFVKGVIDIIRIPKNRLKLNIRIYEDMNKDECVSYWLKVTGLNIDNLSSVNILSGKKNGKLKYGMCRVRVVKGGDVLKYLVAIRQRMIKFF